MAVGLAGSGAWATDFHAPMLAAGPETRLAGVWARRPEAARTLAERFSVPAFTDYAEFLKACEAVAFALAPGAQPALAAEAARAGRAVLLDKPLARTLADAEALAGTIDAAGVPSQLLLTRRFRPQVREFLRRAERFPVSGAQASHLTGELLAGARPAAWRRRDGALPDFAPHALDLLDATAGWIKDIGAVGDLHGYMALTCLHEGGAVSQLALSGSIPTPQGHRKTLDLYGPKGSLTLDVRELAEDSAQTRSNVRSEFAAAVRSGRSHPIAVHRGLYLQRLIDQVRAQLIGA
ncbi:Gfo/Idh/MocA family oxidoreductase [Planotetraspora kaengkrachanensis]|uniref:Dehydrogenase n=1 Tax=Planotetraspora kaengkrachanensis TaxID=575193 RepID=A0A8J3PQ91_9ACTN|nr:dehydrogenase [Planotetraspora kaengkrachanensis]